MIPALSEPTAPARGLSPVSAPNLLAGASVFPVLLDASQTGTTEEAEQPEAAADPPNELVAYPSSALPHAPALGKDLPTGGTRMPNTPERPERRAALPSEPIALDSIANPAAGETLPLSAPPRSPSGAVLAIPADPAAPHSAPRSNAAPASSNPALPVALEAIAQQAAILPLAPVALNPAVPLALLRPTPTALTPQAVPDAPQPVGARAPEAKPAPELAGTASVGPALAPDLAAPEAGPTLTTASATAPTASHGHAAAQPAPANAPTAALSDPRADVRPAAQLEAAIEQLAEARANGRAARPELTLRHQEFGAVTLRIEAAGTDLRATLASRDPGFVPAVHAALAERAIAPTTESASAQSQRGSDQTPGQQHNSHGNPGQSGGSGEGRYGFSPGSGHAMSQPYRGQTERDEEQPAAQTHSGTADDPAGRVRGQGLFA